MPKYNRVMPQPQGSLYASFAFVWATIFLSTIVSGVLAVASLLLVAQSRGGVLLMPVNAGFGQVLGLSALLGIALGAPVGAVSGAICAPALVRRSKTAVFWTMLLVSVIVGPLTSPIFHVFAAGLVLVAQGIATIILCFVLEDVSEDIADGTRCAGCGYFLAGLDRLRTGVCPECGEALPAERAQGRVLPNTTLS
jgi:predicted RNA-binding Zn-ribbon protein involved in translation (DUF1610 family)